MDYGAVSSRHFLRAAAMDRPRSRRVALISAVLLLAAVAVWSQWSTIVYLFEAWQRNDDYSAGLIVPLLAGFLVWRERNVLRQCSAAPCWWGGIGLLVLAEMAWTFGMLTFRASPGQYALVLTVASLVLMTAGWQVFRRVVWILLFLFLMVPLPGRIHNLISLPLQSIATKGSVVLLEAVGTSVSRQGNIVTLNGDTPLAVAEACSGLRMLIAFVIAAALIAYLVKRPRWQKAVLLASSIPVAVICNVIRIFATALLMLYVGSEVGQKFFHDIGGFVMIAIAVSLLFGEIRLMDRLIVSESNTPQKQVIVAARATPKGQAKLARHQA
jgi:exosortase